MVARLAKGEPLRSATRIEHIAPQTVHRLNEERLLFGYFYRPGKRGQAVFAGYWVRHHARMPVLTWDGAYYPETPLDKVNASLVGRYWNAVDEALRGRTAALQPFANTVIYDTAGNRYRLQTE